MYKLIILLFLCVACSKKDTPLGSEEIAPFNIPIQSPSITFFSPRSMLNHLVYNIISPHYQTFSESVETLFFHIDDYCNTQDSPPLKTLQDSWKTSMLHFHRLEAFQMGPIAENEFRLKTRIYTPLRTEKHLLGSDFGHCQVDTQIVKMSTTPIEDYVMKDKDEIRGLGVLEYIIFDEGDKDTDRRARCPVATSSEANGQSSTTVQFEWNNKTNAQRKKDRCAYMKMVVRDLKATSSHLANEWEKNNWGKNLVMERMDKGSMNIVFESLFQLETIKDEKFKFIKEQDLSLLDFVEHQDSNLFFEGIAASLEGFLWVFTGDTQDHQGPGFIDLMAVLGESELGDEIISTTQKTIKDLRKMAETADLKKHLEDKDFLYEETLKVYSNIQRLSSILKKDLPGILNLSEPTSVQGDSD